MDLIFGTDVILGLWAGQRMVLCMQYGQEVWFHVLFKTSIYSLYKVMNVMEIFIDVCHVL